MNQNIGREYNYNKIHSMESKKSQAFLNWLNYSPFIYSYLSIHQLKGYRTIRDIFWQTKQNDNSSLRFLSNNLLACGKGNKNESLLTSLQFVSPKNLADLDQQRIIPQLKKNSELSFKEQIRQIQQCMPTNDRSFVSVLFPNSGFSLHRTNKLEEKAKAQIKFQQYGQLMCHQYKGISCIMGNQSGHITCWNPFQKTDSPLQTFKYHKSPINDICWMAYQSESQFVSVSSDSFAILWDIRTKYPAYKFEAHKNYSILKVCAVSRNQILTGGSEGYIKFWDIRKKKNYVYKQHEKKITGMVLIGCSDKDGPQFVSGSQDGKIIILSQNPQFVHLGHQSAIQGLDYNSKTKYYVSSEEKSNSLMIWRPNQNLISTNK